jgi:DnaJ-class molecular chaperone
LARENDALRAEVQRLTWQGLQSMPRHGLSDDPYAMLHVSRNAPPEVIEAAYRALVKIYHADFCRSNAAMKRINMTCEAILER